MPPIHHNCRCVTVPVLKGMRDDPSQTQINYKDWFNGLDRKTKLDILGPSRFKEYLAGKAVTAFAKDGQIRTLKELGVDRITRKELLESVSVELNLTGNEFSFDNITPESLDEMAKGSAFDYKTSWRTFERMTIDGVVNELKDKYGITFVNARNMDVGIARQFAYNLAKLNERLPGFVSKTGNLYFNPVIDAVEQGLNSTFAYFKTGDNSIHIVGNMRDLQNINTLENFYQGISNKKWWPTGGNGMTPVIHEWGHLWHTLVDKAGIDNNNISKAIGFALPTKTGGGITEMVWNQVRTYFNNSLKPYGFEWDINFVKASLSEYANETNHEFLSEAFAEYMTSTNPRAFANIVGNIITRIWRDYGHLF